MDKQHRWNAPHSPRGDVSREVGGAGIAGSPGVSEGGPVDPEATRSEELDAARKSFGLPSGERGDLGDSGPGED